MCAFGCSLAAEETKDVLDARGNGDVPAICHVEGLDSSRDAYPGSVASIYMPE